MKKYIKSVLAVSLFNALTFTAANAATYKVEPITELSSHKYSYGVKQIGNAQEFIVSATNQYNFPVITQFLLNDIVLRSNALGTFPVFVYVDGQGQERTLGIIEDLDAYIAGEPTANDIALSVSYLNIKSADLNYQKANGSDVYYDFGAGAEKLEIWDQPFSIQFPELTGSTTDYLAGVTSNGWLYGGGSAPYLPFIYSGIALDENNNQEIVARVKWLREFDNKAFISLDMGQTIKAVEAPLNLYGGVSVISDMAEVGGFQTAVGYASVGYSEPFLTVIESSGSGQDENNNGLLDEEEISGCRNPQLNVIEQEECILLLRPSLYYNQAYKWVFDDAGNVIDEALLGILITPHVDDTRTHNSAVVDINSTGVAVGFSKGWRNEDVERPLINQPVSDYAVIYKNGELIDLTPIHSELLNSYAVAINDAGLTTGYATKLVNGTYRTKFFYADTTNETIEVVFPKDFFTGSSSKATAINENGFIVGEGEVERHSNSGELAPSDNPRRRNGFLYDTNTDTFSNLNDFLECNAEYEIISATDINELNEITATAIQTVPARDAKGEIVLDANGETVYEDVIRAVKLTPIAGENVNCDLVEGNFIERKGASISWFALCLLGFFSVFRRRRV